MPIIVKGQRPVSLFLKHVLLSGCMGIVMLYLLSLIIYRTVDSGFDFLNVLYGLLLLRIAYAVRKMYYYEVSTYDQIREVLHSYILHLRYSNEEELEKHFAGMGRFKDLPDGGVKTIESVRNRIQDVLEKGTDSFERYVTVCAITIYVDQHQAHVAEFNRNHKWYYYGENLVYFSVIVAAAMLILTKFI